tara:strand:- start:1991 stop:3064 length:1074 start_codon:yes stop_codon:yes gene_type:complete
MADFNVNHITGKQGQQGTVLAGVTTVSSTGSMRIPSGPTEQRGGRGRGVFCGGYYGAAPSPSNIDASMDYVEIATTGNATDFGDMAYVAAKQGSVSSSTRGVTGGGISPSNLAKMQYVIISSKGGGSTFGDLTLARTHPAAASNTTRGLFAGGWNPISFNVIDYITIATTGGASDFGDLKQPRWFAGNGRASTTRMVFIGGVTQSVAPWSPAPNALYENMIDYVEIATKGNSQDFGELSGGLKGYGMGCGNASSTTRTVTMGGYYDPADVNTIHYLTFATKGNSNDFGDLLATTRGGGSTSSQTRGLLAGGRTPTQVNTIQYITIATTGNATDFGDSTRIVAFNNAGLSDCHGGLGE